jgi:class 3 adenylate cyclase
MAARRLAAILAADVVGYSRLMAADEQGTHARLKALRQDFIEPKIAEHHGRIVKLMGDGALVEFASVVDALECAAAIQSGVVERQADLPEDRRIAFRIGINIGDVIVRDMISRSATHMREGHSVRCGQMNASQYLMRASDRTWQVLHLHSYACVLGNGFCLSSSV